MSSGNVETSVILWGDRHFPPEVVQEQCRVLESHPGVDGALFADQLVNFIPTQLWNEDTTPMARIMRDPDSHSDALMVAAWAAAAAPGLNITVSTDSVRRAPAELIQSMLTLAGMTHGKASFHIGGGEQKQCAPYGHKRSLGISRMEELFQIFRQITETDGPIDFEGKRFTFQKASIGSAMPHLPKIFGLGGGPRLLENAARYADGLAAAVPVVWSTPEQLAELIADIRAKVAEHGRDPDEFRFAAWCPALVHEDRDELEKGFDATLVRFMTGIFGRIHLPDWEKEGLPLPAPPDWSYFNNLLPYDTDQVFIDQVLDTVTREHVLKAWFHGTPEEVAEQIQPYIDAGVDWIMPLDYLPLVRDPDEAEAAFGRTLDVCAAVKGVRQPA